jgi:hypothetical protein
MFGKLELRTNGFGPFGDHAVERLAGFIVPDFN